MENAAVFEAYRAIEPGDWQENPYNEFVEAIRSGDLPRVREMLQSGNVAPAGVPGPPLPAANPPIIEALIAGRRPINALLVTTDPPGCVAARDIKFGGTSLHWAAALGDEGIARALLTYRADANARSWDGWTPAHLAAAYGHVGIMYLLFLYGASANATSPTQVTPLHLAAEKGHTGLIHLLLQHGADPLAVDAERFSPLMRAAAANQHCCMLPLLDTKMDVHARDATTGRTCLHWAAHQGHNDIVEVLLQMTMVDINAGDRRQDTPLHLAARRGFRGIVQQLLIQGAWREPLNAGGVTPLLAAAFFGHPPVVELLLSRGAKAAEADRTHRRTALHWAAHNDDTDVLRLLLDVGADQGALDAGGHSALQLALEVDASNAVELLAAELLQSASMDT